MIDDPTILFYEFGDFTIDVRRQLLLKENESVPLTRKAFATLLLLVQNAGQTLEKDDILTGLWPDSFVEESNISQYIYVLRRTLCSEYNKYNYIETIPKRGYKFVSEVLVVYANAQDPDSPDATGIAQLEDSFVEGITRYPPWPKMPLGPRYRWRVVTSAWVMVFIVLLITGIFIHRRSYAPQRSSIKFDTLAILPFNQNSQEDPDDLLGLAMANALIIRLGKSTRLTILPLASVAHYRNNVSDPTPVGRALGANKVLSGTIQRSNQRLRVSIQLLNAGDGNTLWAENFEEELLDVCRLQDSISDRVAEIL